MRISGWSSDVCSSDLPARVAFAAEGLVPDLAALDYIARAVTPPHSPIRFNTRFFLADGTRRNAPLPHSDEREEIGWRKLAEVQGTMQMASVTHFVPEIGRASSRGRGCQAGTVAVGGGSV